MVRLDRCRVGVAFVAMQRPGDQDPAAWFAEFVRVTPGMVPLLRHVPDRVATDSPLFLLPPPRSVVDFTPRELAVVARVRNGITVEELLGATGLEKGHEGRMVFAPLRGA